VWHVAPRRAAAYEIHLRARFEDLSQIVVALRGILSEEREVWGHERPLFIRNVTGVWFSSSHEQMLSCSD
jgi:hypothetical protein